jgi:hypothetical protein
MGSALGSLVSWAFMNLPFLFIALAAGLAWTRRKKSVPLTLQVLGAFGLFTVAAARWLVVWILGLMGARYSLYSLIYIVFNFLTALMLLLFAAGYIWEKYRQWREGPAEAAAFPVQ